MPTLKQSFDRTWRDNYPPATGSVALETARNIAMRVNLLALLLCVWPLVAFGAETPSQTNCALQEPPEEAGELIPVAGRTQSAGRVFPRLSQIPVDYTGCQVAWIRVDGQTTVRSATLVRSGHVVSVMPTPTEGAVCEQGERTVKTGCDSLRYYVLVSYPPGCAARAVATGQVPQDCHKAFMDEFKIWDQFSDWGERVQPN